MDCCLPADFFLVDDLRRHDEIDPTLGADAHVHFDAPAFTSGLRDWRNAAVAPREPSKPRGPYPGARRRRASPRVTDICAPEWRPL